LFRDGVIIGDVIPDLSGHDLDDPPIGLLHPHILDHGEESLTSKRTGDVELLFL